MLNSSMKTLAETLKDAMAKKHAGVHPDAKQNKSNSKKSSAGTAPKGPPQRRAASRGG